MTTEKLNYFLGSLRAISTALLLNAFFAPAYGEIIVPYIPANQLVVDVQPLVTKDPHTHIYTYSYTITNRPTSLQEMRKFAIEFEPGGGEIFNAASPPGWRFGVHLDQPLASWGAVGSDEPPPGYVDDGNIRPSPFQIKPGQTLGGFSFQTFAAPADGKFYATGFTKLPQATNEGEIPEESIPTWWEDSYSSLTTTPNLLPYKGGRRPAVDGFLVFLNVRREGNVFKSPATIVVKFSAAGESVNRSTFSATLNQLDVTNLFVPNNKYGGDLAAQFTFQNSPLRVGRNVLITGVKGTVPGTTRTATDVDRISFEVQN